MKRKRYNICVIEDSEILRDLATWHLSQNEELEVKSFANGEELLRNLDYKPDVIILDYHLDSVAKKAMNGMKLVKMFKEIPIVIWSGQTRATIAVKLLKAGVWDYVSKDDQSFDNLQSSVEKIIECHYEGRIETT